MDEAILKIVTVGQGGSAGGGGGSPGAPSGPPSPPSAGSILGQTGRSVGGVPGAMMSVAGSVMTGVGVAGALVGLQVAATAATAAVGDFAARMLSASYNASQSAALVGEIGKDVGKAFTGVGAAAVAAGFAFANPLMIGLGVASVGLGIFTGILGEASSALGKVIDALDGMVERYAQYSPGLAIAQAQAEVTQIMGDLRRAREATPALLEYIRARTELQQRFEDAKIRFMERIMPAVISGMEFVEKFLPVIEGMLDILSGIASMIPGIGDKIDEVRRRMEQDQLQVGMEDLASVILGQVEGPRFPFEARSEGATNPLEQ